MTYIKLNIPIHGCYILINRKTVFDWKIPKTRRLRKFVKIVIFSGNLQSGTRRA